MSAPPTLTKAELLARLEKLEALNTKVARMQKHMFFRMDMDGALRHWIPPEPVPMDPAPSTRPHIKRVTA